MNKLLKLIKREYKIVFSILIISGGIGYMGILCLLSGIEDIVQAIESIDWPKTDGIIIQSEYKTKYTGSSTSGDINRRDPSYSYTPMIYYRYKVDGSSLVNDQVSWKSGTNLEIVEAMVQKYPLNKKVTVYYTPETPKIAVLEPGFTGELLLSPFFGVGFLSIALISALLIWKYGSSYENGLFRVAILILLVIGALYLLTSYFKANLVGYQGPPKYIALI